MSHCFTSVEFFTGYDLFLTNPLRLYKCYKKWLIEEWLIINKNFHLVELVAYYHFFRFKERIFAKNIEIISILSSSSSTYVRINSIISRWPLHS